MTFATIFILAITVEALVEYSKLIFTKKINWKQLGAMGVAVLLSVAAGTDLFRELGVAFQIPFLGMVLTGIIFSRGANYLADFITLTQNTSSSMRELKEGDKSDG